MYLPFLLWTFVLATLVALSSTYAITGAQSGVDTATGSRPLRQDFTKFETAGPAFDLYILALRDFAQQDQTTLLSYYQVSGLGAMMVLLEI